MARMAAGGRGRAGAGVIVALVLAVVTGLAPPASAQLLGGAPALPSLPALPAAGLPNAGGVLAGVGDDLPAVTRLTDLRAARLRALVRDHAKVIDVDGAGAPVVRSQVLAIAPGEAALTAARAAGFAVGEPSRLEALGVTLVVLTAPKGMSTRAALARLRQLDPGGAYDFNHIYTGSGEGSGGRGGAAGAKGAATSRGAVGAARLGLLDTGVMVSHPAFAAAPLEQRGFAAGGLTAGAHGTAVASLLVGRDGAFHGAAPGEALKVADVYGSGPTGGSAEAIVRALGWMAEGQVRVVNVSLVGPANAILAAGVRGAQAHGVLLVAAVGNDGPAAAPLYPAAYPGVISVTAVDGRRRVLLEAGRAGHVDFAAPGADMAAARAGGGYVAVRGTSFAAPIVAGLLARSGGGPDAVAALARDAVDLGAPGPDAVYGRGLVGEAARVAPAAVRARRAD